MDFTNPINLVWQEMFGFVHKGLMLHRTRDCFRMALVRHLRTLPSSNSISDNSLISQSLTVSYLRYSCGLSLESAVSASKLIHIRNREKSDSVLELFTAHGFTKPYITTLISKGPSLLLADPVKTLKPKLEFFESLGLVGPELAKILISDKSILFSSLENQIMATINFLKDLVKTNEKVILALKHCSRVVRYNLQKELVPNMNTLRAHGVPEPRIVSLIVMQPKSLFSRPDLFEKVVIAVKDMGFDPRKSTFVLAVQTLSVMRKMDWEKKHELFMSFGWSEHDFRSAFVKQPMFMWCSEKKITAFMDFFVNKLGLKPSDVVKCPNLFLTSFVNRIIPRCSVVQVLISKGLKVKKNFDVVWILNLVKKSFETKFLIPFKDDAPEVIKAYQDSMGLQGFNDGLQLLETDTK